MQGTREATELRTISLSRIVQYGKPSLVCDLQELYRYLVDDFVIQFSQGLKKRDFTIKIEAISRKRKEMRKNKGLRL